VNARAEMSSTSPLNTIQVQRAVDAILNHTKISKSGKGQLFDESAPISVIFALKKIPSINGRTRPYMM
jgi:hypothetical protein